MSSNRPFSNFISTTSTHDINSGLSSYDIQIRLVTLHSPGGEVQLCISLCYRLGALPRVERCLLEWRPRINEDPRLFSWSFRLHLYT